MTNRLHTFFAAHLATPLDALYARMDEDQLDGTRTPMTLDRSVMTEREPARARLRHAIR